MIDMIHKPARLGKELLQPALATSRRLSRDNVQYI